VVPTLKAGSSVTVGSATAFMSASLNLSTGSTSGGGGLGLPLLNPNSCVTVIWEAWDLRDAILLSNYL